MAKNDEVTVEELADRIRDDKLDVQDTVDLAGDDPDMVQKVLDAEAEVHDTPRKGVLDKLEAKVSSLEEEEYEEDDEETTAEATSGSTDELPPVIHPGAFVRLQEAEGVPDEHVGTIAAVIEAPRVEMGPDDHSPRTYEYQPEDTVFVVRTRDATDATLNVTRDAFSEIGYEGRKDLLPHG